jgi:hypothetical protein
MATLNKRLYDSVTHISNGLIQLEIVTRQMHSNDNYDIQAYRALERAIIKCDKAIKDIESKPVRKFLLRIS